MSRTSRGRGRGRVIAIAAVAAATMLMTAAPASANTYHVSVHGGGHVGVPSGARGGVMVRVHNPIGVTVRPPVYLSPPVRSHIWYRPHRYGYGYGYGYAYWNNPYYYNYGYYYPTAYVVAPQTGPETVVYGSTQPREPNIGVGMRGSAIRAGTDRPAAEGFGALLRFRSHPVELELEVGWDRYGSDTDRNDTRVATSLYVPVAGTVVQPYLVVGAGMNFAHFGATGDNLHQGFLAAGGGLALNFSRSLTIAADARYMVREFFDDDAMVAKQPIMIDPTVSPDKHDQAVEFRANAILYF